MFLRQDSSVILNWSRATCQVYPRRDSGAIYDPYGSVFNPAFLARFPPGSREWGSQGRPRGGGKDDRAGHIARGFETTQPDRPGMQSRASAPYEKRPAKD